jgi:two-component system OmpR family response regulator
VKILVVDDDPGMRMMLGSFFRDKGCEVREASDGDSAAAAVGDDTPDAITLDFQMGQYSDGADFRAELAKSSATANIPIVVYSGAGESSVRAAFDLGERLRFVPKPGNLDLLWNAVEEMTA